MLRRTATILPLTVAAAAAASRIPQVSTRRTGEVLSKVGLLWMPGLGLDHAGISSVPSDALQLISCANTMLMCKLPGRRPPVLQKAPLGCSSGAATANEPENKLVAVLRKGSQANHPQPSTSQSGDNAHRPVVSGLPSIGAVC